MICAILVYAMIVFLFLKVTNMFYWEKTDGIQLGGTGGIGVGASLDMPDPAAPTPGVEATAGDSYIRGLREAAVEGSVSSPPEEGDHPLKFTNEPSTTQQDTPINSTPDSYLSIALATIRPHIHNIDEKLFERIILLGFTLVATLTGMSSSQLPFKFLLSFCIVRHQELMDSMEFETLQQKMSRTERMMEERIRKLEKLQKDKASSDKASQSHGILSFFSRASSSILPLTTPSEATIDQTIAEIEALESLREDLYLDVQATKELQDQLAYRGTWFGKLSFVLGFIVSLWCCFRITLSVLNIAWDRRRHLDRDPIVAQLLALVSHKTGFDMVSLHHHATLVIIFLVILLSVRGLLLNVHRVFRKIFHSLSTNLIIQAFATLMPIYTLSLVMLFRIHLPKSNRAILSTVLESHHEQLFYSIFDRTFVIAAAVSLVAVCIISRFSRVPKTQSRDM
mmetsp:Transcript_8498/g.31448  ORF Transcript_8498/g.31448 Transcript_8498/m.31448 type:complete len:452 (+) Transcript_8498:1874-3229(+)